MTTTAGNIIERAIRLLSLTNAGDTPEDSEYTDGLTALNDLMDAWLSDGLMCYATQEEQVTLVTNQASYTVGPSGAGLVTARPVDVIRFFARTSSGYDYFVRKVDAEVYSAIVDKNAKAEFPTHAFYDPTMPNGTIYVWPKPSASTNYIRFISRVQFTEFASTSTTVTLPPGWREALAFNLAIAIAPEYNEEPSLTVVTRAREALGRIKRTNSRPVNSPTELGFLIGRRRANILTDEP